MLGDLQLGYLGVEVPDVAGLSGFFADVVGLAPGDDPGTWRNDSKAHRVIVAEGPSADATFVGFEAAGPDAWAATVARLEDAGYSVAHATAEEADARRVVQLASVEAPWGIRVEVAHGLAEAEQPFASPLVEGGFVTEGKGFGHVVFGTTAFDESHRFVTEGLGLRQTDWVETELAAGIELEIRFYHCNPRHHSLALARAPFELPQRLHHFMVEVADRDDVGYAFDRAWNAGCVIASGLGRHPNDRMFSFYVASPAGFQVEVGHGARLVTESWDENRRYDRISSWGHQPLQPPDPASVRRP
jgi:2,3-dihydroxybiphenyl 1,2-dioxygenase